MMIYIRFTPFILIIFTLQLLLSCNKINSDSKESGTDYYFIVEQDSILSIKNNTLQKIRLQIDINEKFANHIDDLLKKIHALQDEFDEEPIIRKAWRFVGTEIDFFNPVSSNNNFDIPLLIYNSIGFGQCDDLSVLLHTIYTRMGYTSRVVNVKDHVVVEVFNGQKWEMYDAFQYVYYLNQRGQVASVEELSKDSFLILHPVEKIHPPDNFSAEKKIRLKQNYSPQGINYFYNISPFEYNILDHQSDSIYIELPPYGKLEIPATSPEPIYKYGVSGKGQHKAYVKYVIPKGFKGEFKTPFLITSLHGNGSVKINKQTISIGNFILKMDYNTTEQPIRAFEILHSQSDIIVYCMLSENLLKEKNIIRISSYSDISFKKLPDKEFYSNISSDFIFEKKNSSNSKIINSLYNEYYEISSQLKISTLDTYNSNDFIEDIFTFFAIIHLENSQHRTQKIIKKLKYIEEYNQNHTTDLFILLKSKNIQYFIAFVYLLDEFSKEEIIRILVKWQQEGNL